jgi:hypothetical protein
MVTIALKNVPARGLLNQLAIVAIGNDRTVKTIAHPFGAVGPRTAGAIGYLPKTKLA